MGDNFGLTYSGLPFEYFGVPHLIVIGLVILICIAILLMRDRFSERQRVWVRYGLAILIVVSESSWHVWALATRQWSIDVMLPLWLCSLTAWLSPLMLIWKSKRVYEFIYLMGITGASMAILTPSLTIYGFPHFRFIEFFVLHGALIVGAVWMTAVEKMRPTRRSILRVVIAMNLLWAFAALVNELIGSNYLYTHTKLPTLSLLDYLGPHPWYLLSMEAIGLGLMLLFYLPFALRDGKQQGGSSFAIIFPSNRIQEE
jgi:hypothetical integral membrane protein (TIGR02206 family)